MEIAARVDEEEFAVAGPVGGFDDAAGLVDLGALLGAEVMDHDSAAVERTGFKLRALEGDVREDGGFEDVRVVRADAETDVGGVGEFEGEGADGFADEDLDLIALAFDAEASGALGRGTDFGGGTAFDSAVSEGGEAVAMDGDVGIDGVGVEILTEHEHGLAVGVDTGAEEADVGLEGDIAGGPAPEEVEGVLRAPDVGSAAGDVIFGGDGLIDGGAGFRGEPEVAVGVEETVLSGEGQTERG